MTLASVHTPTMTLKNAALLALIGTILITSVLEAKSMSSNDLEGKHVSFGGDIRCCWDRASCVVNHPFDIFSQGIEKEYCNSGL